MHDPAHMPQLTDDLATGLMDLFDHRFPCFGLLVVPDAGRERSAQALLADSGGFRDYQTGAGALAVIFSHDRGGHKVDRRAAASEGGHEHAVLGFDSANGDRIEQCGQDEIP